MSDHNRVYLFDTTLRDGEQAPGVSLNVEEKLEIAHQLERLGVDVIEAGFPVTSLGDFEAVSAIAKKVRGCEIAGLSRCIAKDVDRTWEALQEAKTPRIHVFLASSDIHLEHKLRMSREQMLEQAATVVRHAKQYCEQVEFSAEDASRTDPDFLAQVVSAVIDAGATVVNLPDTVGYAVPEQFGQFIAEVMSKVPNVQRAIISTHCHDDLGMAVANSLSAAAHGARQLECTINGIGERAGNASLEEIAMGLYTRKSFYGLDTGIRYQEIARTSRLVSSLTGVAVPPNKAIVGANAFLHESGIHQDGVLKHRSTYEIMNAELIGIYQSNLALGKHSGRHAFNQRLSEMGYELSEEELNKAFTSFKELTDRKKEINDEDIEALVNERMWSVPERFSLQYLHTSSGTNTISTATVVLEIQEMPFEYAATGAGPVEAACHAIDRITDIYGKLISYKLNAVGSGKDALGEVLSQVRIGDRIYNGRGLSTNIIEASVRSYLNAINKYYHEQQR